MNGGKIALFLGSLLIATLMWLQVVERVSTREITVPLERVGLPRGMVVPFPTEQVRVSVRGSSSEVERLDPRAVKATVDLSRVTAGSVDLLVSVAIPPGTRLEITPVNPRVRMSVEREIELEVPVKVVTQGVPGDGFIYDGAKTFPQSVKVVGAESLLPRIVEAQVLLNLSTLRPGTTPNSEVRLVDNENQLVPVTRVLPDTVTVTPSLTPAPSSRRVLVVAVFTGQPKFGTNVKSYTIEPESVNLRGPSALLAGRLTVETEPISLAGLDSRRTQHVKLRLPEGVTADVEEVTITLTVGSSREPSP